MNSNEYMSKSWDTIKYRPMTPEAKLYASLGLCGEAGEVANIVKKEWRDGKLTREEMQRELQDEMGDIFWYLSVLCLEYDLSFESIMAFNIAKLKERYKSCLK